MGTRIYELDASQTYYKRVNSGGGVSVPKAETSRYDWSRGRGIIEDVRTARDDGNRIYSVYVARVLPDIGGGGVEMGLACAQELV